ncbi:hypothetical protein [Chroococcus sp. FPU101]|uniref:hypothetical protein n=1 Tax=Chroococcus sp. FPU101 TaxID=1974212 RepID=UPI001A8EF860|nr:hypothetical protein [Chroococcus sp. FPU101]GFE71802.1 unknown protein [Chroococcus sp. FPU101]
MTRSLHRAVPPRQPIFANLPRRNETEIAQALAENQAFAERCREIFRRVAPDLMEQYRDWYIIIEPNSGEYFIAPDEMAALRQAKEKYPTPDLYAMCLNETGACGRI